MSPELLKEIAQVAAPAGLAIGVFLLVSRDVIAKNIFPRLTTERAYHVIVVLAFMAWTIALAGIAAWVYVSKPPNPQDGDVKIARYINAIIFNANDIRGSEIEIADHIEKNIPGFRKTIQYSWDGRVLYGQTIVVYVRDDFKDVAMKIGQLISGNPKIVRYSGSQFFGLENRDIAIFVGKDAVTRSVQDTR